MLRAGSQALRVTGLQGVAGAGAQGVDGATHLLADFAAQGHAAGLPAGRALHATLVVIEFLRQADRDGASWSVIGLPPIERDPEVGAAGATGLTVKRSAHTLTGPNAAAGS